MKKKKNLLIYGVIILIGVACFMLLCERAEQIDNNMEVSYEKSY